MNTKFTGFFLLISIFLLPLCLFADNSENIKFQTNKVRELRNGSRVEYGEFVLNAGLPRNKTVKVHYGIALSRDGNPVAEAMNIVFKAPFMPERKFIKNRQFRWFHEKYGYTIFSFDINSDIKEVALRDKIYYYKESGFHDLVFKAQKILQNRFKLKAQKLLVVGESAGGTMAQQLGCYSSDKIDAVAIIGGHRFDIPKKANKTAWLSMHTTGDFQRINEQYKIHEQMNKWGLQLLQSEMPPNWEKKGDRYFHHAPSLESWRVIQIFIKGIVKLRKHTGGKLPDYHKWPVSSVYGGRKWYYPSQEFANIWNSYPHEAIAKLAVNNGEPIYFIPTDKPKAIVIYIHDPFINGEVLLIDTLYYLMKQQVIACTVKISDDSFQSLSAIENLIKEVQAKAEWEKLPIYVAGLGRGGQLAAIAVFNKGENVRKKRITKKNNGVEMVQTVYERYSRIKKITSINSSYDAPFWQLSVVKMRKKRKCRIPMRMIFSSGYNEPISSKPSYTKIEQLNEKDLTLGKQWATVIEQIAKGK